jgi:putative permease
MKSSERILKQRQERVHYLLFYLTMTAALASGLAIYFSASTVLELAKDATSGLFLPLLLSLILTFLLQPVVGFIEREEISRSTAILIVYLLLAGAGFLLVGFFIPHWQQTWASLQTDLPRYMARMAAFLKELQSALLAHLPLIEHYDLPGRARHSAEQFVAQLLVQSPRQVLRLGSLILLVPLFTFFFLRDGRKIMRIFIGLAPNRYFEMAHDLTALVTSQLSHFIRGRILEAAIVGLVVTAGLSCTDIRYALFLGVFAGVTNLVPYIGPLVGMVPGLLIALVDLGMGGQFWWIFIVYFLIAQVIVDNFLLIPILISRVSNLHPLWVIIAIVMGGKLYGVLGMIIAVPIASIIKIVLIEIHQYRRAFALPDAVADGDRLP